MAESMIDRLEEERIHTQSSDIHHAAPSACLLESQQESGGEKVPLEHTNQEVLQHSRRDTSELKPEAAPSYTNDQAKLQKLVATHSEFSAEDKVRFNKDLDLFTNTRCQQIADNLRKSGISCYQRQAEREIADTFDNIAKILTVSDHRDIPLTARHRAWIAQQVMHQAANPYLIFQGYHNTCNAAVLEVQMYTKRPAQAARLVASIACSGSYTTEDCKHTVTLNSTSMTPHADWSAAAKKQWPLSNFPGDNIRSLASQLWQATAINLFHSQPNSPFKGQLEYVQGEAVAENLTGDYFVLVDLNCLTGAALTEAQELKRNGKEIRIDQLQGSPEMNAEGIQKLHDLIMPNDKDENGRSMPALIEIGTTPNGGISPRSLYIGKQDPLEGAKELSNQLQQLRNKGHLPIAFATNVNNAPFQGDLGTGWADVSNLSGGGHIINITDIKQDKVAYDNQNIPANDHLDDARMIPVEVMYQSALTPTIHSVYLNAKTLFEQALDNASKLQPAEKQKLKLEMQNQEGTVRDEVKLLKWYQAKFDELRAKK